MRQIAVHPERHPLERPRGPHGVQMGKQQEPRLAVVLGAEAGADYLAVVVHPAAERRQLGRDELADVGDPRGVAGRALELDQPP